MCYITLCNLYYAINRQINGRCRCKVLISSRVMDSVGAVVLGNPAGIGG